MHNSDTLNRVLRISLFLLDTFPSAGILGTEAFRVKGLGFYLRSVQLDTEYTRSPKFLRNL